MKHARDKVKTRPVADGTEVPGDFFESENHRVPVGHPIIPIPEQDLQSPLKVSEQQGQFLCFCYTLKTIEFEAQKCT